MKEAVRTVQRAPGRNRFKLWGQPGAQSNRSRPVSTSRAQTAHYLVCAERLHNHISLSYLRAEIETFLLHVFEWHEKLQCQTSNVCLRLQDITFYTSSYTGILLFRAYCG